MSSLIPGVNAPFKGYSKIVQLNATALERYNSCKLDFYRSEVFSDSACFQKKIKGGINLVLGSCTHSVVERFLTEYQNNATIGCDRLLLIYQQVIKNYKLPKDLLLLGLGRLKQFYQYFIEEQHYPLSAEEIEFSVETTVKYKKLKVRLAGRIDFLNKVDDKVDVVDWKFNKLPKLKKNGRDRVIGYYQLAIYAYLLNRKDLGRLICFYINPEGVEEFSWEYGRQARIDVQELYTEVLDKIAADYKYPWEWEPIKNEYCTSCYTRKCKLCPLFGGALPSEYELEESDGIRKWKELL
ncbi:PD-(D/E)XK nuclease family protein [Mastigocoleus testarum]|uniref:PD-(D/E)XK nuclease family protein n=1 Tax=Mastigocoleus testarum TaxID=996925 RepID=UPI00071B22FB|nr:PD-(D/E)XK nuclease family protein [Mastigocoleus testarum]